jgi:hypothetical protein
MKNYPKLTMANTKAFNASHKTAELREQVVRLRKEATEIRKRVDAYEAPIFAKYHFKDDEGNPVTDQKLLFTCIESDKEQCDRFYAECQEEHKKQGFNLPDGFCPALVAESNANKAEYALLKHATEVLGVPFDKAVLDLRKQALELLLPRIS